MSIGWYILDSLDGGYAALISAMHTATAAKRTGPVAQSIVDCSYDANLKLVKANITDAEKVGSLSEIATDQEGVGVFVMHIVDLADQQLRAFQQIGVIPRVLPMFARIIISATIGRRRHRARCRQQLRRERAGAIIRMRLPGKISIPLPGLLQQTWTSG